MFFKRALVGCRPRGEKCGKEQNAGRGKGNPLLLPEWNAVYQAAIRQTVILCETEDGRE